MMLSALKSGLNGDARIAVLAANPSQFDKAVEIAMSAEASGKERGETGGVFHTRHFTGGNYNSFRGHNNRGQFYNSRGQYNNNRGHFSNIRGQSNNNGGQYNSNRGQNNNNYRGQSNNNGGQYNNYRGGSSQRGAVASRGQAHSNRGGAQGGGHAVHAVEEQPQQGEEFFRQ